MAGIKSDGNIACLDGLRGMAALWVVLGHGAQLTGLPIALLNRPDYGVDLFIVLSGFLMAYHFIGRAKAEPWEDERTWYIFWLRRFFRISPLYYVLLVVAFLVGPAIGEMRFLVDHFLHRGISPERYLDTGSINLLAHLSFLFGVLPAYAYRTPLPDWSIGLEMQFYLAFPFLMLAIRAIGWVRGAAVIAVSALAIDLAFHRAGIVFPMPAFLPLKLPLFLTGMLIAAALADERDRGVRVTMALGLALVPTLPGDGATGAVIRAAIAAVFAMLILKDLRPRLLARPVAVLDHLLANRAARWLGEMSYGTYLLHLLFLNAVAGWLVARYGHDINSPVRFCLAMAVVIPATLVTSYVCHHAIEQPGTRLGRAVIRRVNRRRAAPASASVDLPPERS